MSSENKSVKMNMVMNALLTISGFIFPLITFPYVSRILLPEGTGKVGLATSVIMYFSMFARLGVPMYGVRACAKVRDDKTELSRTVHELLFINFFMVLIVYIPFVLSICFVPKLRSESTLYIIMGITILLDSLGVEWLYKGLEKYTYITVRSLIFKTISFVALFVMVRTQSDYVIYGGLTVFAASASNILNFINLRKYIYIKSVGKYNWKRHIKMVLVFFSMSVATNIYANLDTVMLGFIKDDVAVGYYNAAVKIKNILLGLVTSASVVLLPRTSYYADKGMMNEFFRVLKKTMHFVCLAGLSFSIYFIIFAKEGILFLSGKEYMGAIMPMMVIMPTLLLIGISHITGIEMMVPLGREKQVLYSEIVGAVVDLILNALLIPRYAATGAAIGTLVAEVSVLVWQLFVIRDIQSKIFRDVPILKVFISTLFAVSAAFWVKLLDINSFLSLVISGICFFGVYAIALLVLKDSLAIEILNIVLRKIKRNN